MFNSVKIIAAAIATVVMLIGNVAIANDCNDLLHEYHLLDRRIQDELLIMSGDKPGYGITRDIQENPVLLRALVALNRQQILLTLMADSKCKLPTTTLFSWWKPR